MPARKKSPFRKIRSSGVRGLLIYFADYIASLPKKEAHSPNGTPRSTNGTEKR